MKKIVLGALLCALPLAVVFPQEFNIVQKNWNAGVVLSIFVDSCGVIFIGTDDLAYRSSDGGKTWVRLDNLEGRISFGDAYIIGRKGGKLYLNDFNRLYQSTDNGDTWVEIFSPDGNHFDVKAMTEAGGSIFAGTFFSRSIYRSTDTGRNWTKVFSTNGGFRTIVATQKGTILAGTGNGDPQGYVEGIYRSTDNGES